MDHLLKKASALKRVLESVACLPWCALYGIAIMPSSLILVKFVFPLRILNSVYFFANYSLGFGPYFHYKFNYAEGQTITVKQLKTKISKSYIS